MSFEALWRADAVRIIGVVGASTVTVRRPAYTYSSTPIASATSTVVDTCTASIFPAGGTLGKERAGLLAETTHMVYLAYTATLQAGDRLTVSGKADYYEVLRVDGFVNHQRAQARYVENR